MGWCLVFMLIYWLACQLLLLLFSLTGIAWTFFCDPSNTSSYISGSFCSLLKGMAPGMLSAFKASKRADDIGGDISCSCLFLFTGIATGTF